MKKISEKSFLMDNCKATPGYEFFPRFISTIDLEKFMSFCIENKYYIDKNNTPFFIIIKIKEGTITIFDTFKVIIRDCEDEKTSKLVFRKIIRLFNSFLKE